MHTWPINDAEARFDELIEACLRNGPQLVTRHGVEAAVLVSVHQWRRLQSSARPSLKALLLSDELRVDFPVRPRGHTRWRLVNPSGIKARR